ncbi:MAG TPA: SDR family oxidoreductase [Woeseiaceae bacterium]|nr:SDR family oxidoreductase [Woeseiaceae bacterium]
MRVLVVGATGLIGSAVCARALAEGHAVVAAIRPGSETRPAGVDGVVEIDVARATDLSDWEPHLDDIQAIVNCAGVLQSGPLQSPQGVHCRGIAALAEACVERRIRRVIHLSAIGVDRGALSEFSESKAAGDAALMAQDLDWVVLRPSVVLGAGAAGAGALFRGLAALPVLPLMPSTGPLQVVQLDDLTRTVMFFLDPSAPGRVVMEVAGPERLALADVVAAHRRWLGWQPARRLPLPAWLATLLYRAGDFAGRLGWRPALRSNAQREIARGAVGDPHYWQELTGITPETLEHALTTRPASPQERWFARLFPLKPVIFIVLGLFWLGTGLVSLGPGFDIGKELLVTSGLPALAAPGVIAGALADMIVGAGMLYRPAARRALYGGIALSIFYLVTGTLLLPELWRDPLGPMMKIWPILVLNIVALMILDER